VGLLKALSVSLEDTLHVANGREAGAPNDWVNQSALGGHRFTIGKHLSHAFYAGQKTVWQPVCQEVLQLFNSNARAPSQTSPSVFHALRILVLARRFADSIGPVFERWPGRITCVF
jgi:hypothetical protein